MLQKDHSNETAEEIRIQIDQTQAGLTDKLEILQGKLSEKAEEAKDLLQDKFKQVQQSFSLSYQIAEHPWQSIAVALATGLVISRVVAADVSVFQDSRSTKSTQLKDPRPSLFSQLGEWARGEFQQASNMAIGSGSALLRQLAIDSLPSTFKPYINKLATSNITKS
jgi:ElaB/YqjD/DUF883 family membrane-anchored ribosome-binding protein